MTEFYVPRDSWPFEGAAMIAWHPEHHWVAWSTKRKRWVHTWSPFDGMTSSHIWDDYGGPVQIDEQEAVTRFGREILVFDPESPLAFIHDEK